MSDDPYQEPVRDYHTPPPYSPPPEGPYGPPPGYNGPPEAKLPLAGAIQQLPRQYMKVLTRPSAATFAEEMSKASWGMLWVQLLGYALFAFIVSLLLIPLYPLLLQRFLGMIPAPSGANPFPPAALQQMQMSFMNSAFSTIASVPVYFFIGQGLYYLLARLFRGTGTFLVQGYTTLLFYTPLAITGNILTILALVLIVLAPSLSGVFAVLVFFALFGLALWVYQIVLQTFTFMATHRLSGGKATTVALLPYVIFLALYLLFIAFIFVLVLFLISATRPH